MDGVPIRFVRFARATSAGGGGQPRPHRKLRNTRGGLRSVPLRLRRGDRRSSRPGRSGRLLADTHRGHVVNFADYVDDFEQLWQREVESRGYRQRFALAHSMGGAIPAQFLQRRPQAFDAAAFCAPMFGIQLPMPVWLADRIPRLGGEPPGDPRLLRGGHRPVASVALCGQRVDPQPRALSAQPALLRRLPRAAGGRADLPLGAESIRAGRQIIAQAGEITTPLLLLQAGEERVVDNRSHQAFCQALSDAGRPLRRGLPWLSTAHAMRSCSSGTRCAPKH
ncbi:alpha/beta hydrolase [Serratia marcescens]|uniref:Alpha/beta hydrolase n=1 Tax=Serratia marcescens TaxID=615 RepID=A0A939NRW2_SERMA|nr:alpha/beta hydrolase [Serratia marcescens]